MGQARLASNRNHGSNLAHAHAQGVQGCNRDPQHEGNPEHALIADQPHFQLGVVIDRGDRAEQGTHAAVALGSRRWNSFLTT
jgi:hypothetical protein